MCFNILRHISRLLLSLPLDLETFLEEQALVAYQAPSFPVRQVLLLWKLLLPWPAAQLCSPGVSGILQPAQDLLHSRIPQAAKAARDESQHHQPESRTRMFTFLGCSSTRLTLGTLNLAQAPLQQRPW